MLIMISRNCESYTKIKQVLRCWRENVIQSDKIHLHHLKTPQEKNNKVFKT